MGIYSSTKMKMRVMRGDALLFLLIALMCTGPVYAQFNEEATKPNFNLNPNGLEKYQDGVDRKLKDGEVNYDLSRQYKVDQKKYNDASLLRTIQNSTNMIDSVVFKKSSGDDCQPDTGQFYTSQFSISLLHKDWKDAACKDVTRHSSCEAVSACVQGTSFDMGSLFADSAANEIIANEFMTNELTKLYPDLISFDAMALYAKEKYQIEYPQEITKGSRKGCYYALELANDKKWCAGNDFAKKQISSVIKNCVNSASSFCTTELPVTEKLSIEDFSKEAKNLKTNSFELDYLNDQRDQLAKYYHAEEEKTNRALFELFNSKEFQNKNDANKIVELEKFSKKDAVLNYLFILDSPKKNIAKNNAYEGLKKNKNLGKLLSFKPSSFENFEKSFDQFKVAEIKDKMQIDRLKAGRCEPRENVTTICAKGKALAEGRLLSHGPSFKFQVDEKSEAFLSLIDTLKIDHEAKKDLSEFGVLFLKSKHCVATGQIDNASLDKKTISNINENLGDIYNSSAAYSNNSKSSWGSEEYNTSKLDFGKMGIDSESGGQVHRPSDESLAEFAKAYSNDSKTAADYTANPINYPSHSTSSNYIPHAIRVPDSSNAGKGGDPVATGQAEVVAGAGGRNTGSLSQSSEDLKATKEQLAKSQQEIQLLKDQMEKDKFAGLESELRKKESKLEKLQAKINSLEKAPIAPAASKVEKSTRTANITSSSIGSLGSSASVNSKVDNATAKFDNKPSASSSAAASRGNDVARAPSAILSSSSSESRSAGIGSKPVIKVDGMSNKDMTESIKKKITELKGGSFFIEENGVIKEIVVETKDGKIVLDENGNPVYKEIEIGKVGDKLLALPEDKTTEPKVKTAADLKKLDENAVKSNNNRGAFYQNLIKETKKVIKSEK